MVTLRSLVIALATGVIAITAAPACAADVNLDKLAGVYKKSFRNGNIDGDKYDSENILEIVKVSPTAAYVRTHLEFFNGHACNMWGVAKAEGDALIYRGPADVEGKKCVLSLKAANGKVTFRDPDDACAHGTCGARGMYNGIAFDLKTRRDIRYMDVLLKSDQYKDAIDESEGKPRTRVP